MPSGRRLPAEQIDRAPHLYEVDGCTFAEIAERFGMQASQVRDRLVAAGVQPRPVGPRRTPVTDDALLEVVIPDACAGLPVVEIAERWDVDRGKIAALLERHGRHAATHPSWGTARRRRPVM